MNSSEDLLKILGREQPLFSQDIEAHSAQLSDAIMNSRCLVIGGAGTIGRAVTKEIFKRNPRALHVVDISENSMVELVRDIRSTIGYSDGDFQTFCLDCGSAAFSAMIKSQRNYDYVFNLSALKHVRSERDPYTLMRMIEVNILNTVKTINLTKNGLKKYFCVSTDKAANPVNMMGASKRIMEMFLVEEGKTATISTARFANVAFSDGSLLEGFRNRIDARQPIAAPRDIKRYFVTPQESGELCLMSGVFGVNQDIFFPENEALQPVTFSSIAREYLGAKGFDVYECESEDEARAKVSTLIPKGKWPCFFSDSDNTGEKPCEEFYTADEQVDRERFANIGVVKNSHEISSNELQKFTGAIHSLLKEEQWSKGSIVGLFQELVPEFHHLETGKYLDQKM